jgi:uncharacterized membrane protein
MDNLLDIIPQRYHPDTLLPFHIPGLGVIATVILVFLCGIMVKSYIGNMIIAWGESLFHKIPVIRNIYEGTKQVVDSMFIHKNKRFQKVVLVAFPHPGSYALGFVTGTALECLTNNIDGSYVNVFVPTTPNPTSGYLVIVPEQELIGVNMSVEDAITYIISCGIVHGPVNGYGDIKKH